MRGIKIVSTGSYLPRRVVKACDVHGSNAVAAGMGEMFETSQARHYADVSETSTWMGIHAARNAIEALPAAKRKIDHVLYWAFCADNESPREGAYIATALGLNDVSSTFVDVGCASSLAMLKIATALFAAEMHERILIVAVANWSGRAFSPGEDLGPVGDGAGAMVVEACPIENTSYLGFSDLRSAEFENAVEVRSRYAYTSDEYLRSNRVEGFKEFAEQEPVRLMRELLMSKQLGPKQIAWFIPNQPSARVNHVWREGIEMPPERMLTTFQRHGNLIGATLPVLLDFANQEGVGPRPGDTALLFTTGTGFHLSALLWKF